MHYRYPGESFTEPQLSRNRMDRLFHADDRHVYTCLLRCRFEIHENTDQIIRIEQGQCSVRMGCCPNELCFRQNLCAGECVCIPAGTWHNIINIGNNPLKLSSIYAPPHHPRGETQATKATAMGMDC